MSVQMIRNAQEQMAADVVAPAAQNSVAGLTVLAGSEIDARLFSSLSYTIKVATNDVKWTVYAGDASDYSDEVVVSAEASVVAGNVSSYSATPPPFGYYRVKIRDTVGGVHGAATVHGMAK